MFPKDEDDDQEAAGSPLHPVMAEVVPVRLKNSKEFPAVTEASPLMARSRAVSFPIPVLAPVMRTVFPFRLLGD